MRRQRGVAFIVVIWLLALLAVIMGAFTLLARTEGLQARFLFDGTQARYAAEAGVNRAVISLYDPDPERRWIPDGRAYEFPFEGAEVSIAVTDESGRIDVNAADQQTLTNLFLSIGLDELEASRMADRIIDFRDPDDLVMPNGAEAPEYEAEGLPYGPKNAPFDLVSELQQVLGMSYERFTQIEPAVTVYTGQGQFNPAFAPLQALRAWPGLDEETARQIIELRHQFNPNTGLMPPSLPDGTPLMAQGGSGTYSIRSRATLPNGAWTELEVTLRLGGVGTSGLAYTVLRWQEGEAL
jgi:general secretion pathway protein K